MHTLIVLFCCTSLNCTKTSCTSHKVCMTSRGNAISERTTQEWFKNLFQWWLWKTLLELEDLQWLIVTNWAPIVLKSNLLCQEFDQRFKVSSETVSLNIYKTGKYGNSDNTFCLKGQWTISCTVCRFLHHLLSAMNLKGSGVFCYENSAKDNETFFIACFCNTYIAFF